MKTLFRITTLVLFLLLAPHRGLALMEISEVRKEAAKEMGIEVRTTPNGANEMWVEVEFRKEGKLKGYDSERFSFVSLEVSDKEKFQLGYAPLREKKTDKGGIVVRFMASKEFVDQVTVRIVVGSGLMPGGAFDVRIRDFLTK